MSLATIIKKIEEEAQTQSQEIIDQARTDDEQIITYARVKADEEATQIVRHAEEELQSVKSKQMATKLLQLRKEKLDNRQRILQEVSSKALQNVIAYDAEQRREIIKSILFSVSEEREGSLLFSKSDQALIDQTFIDAINKKIKEKGRKKLQFKLSKHTADIERGFIIDFEDFEVNCSFQEVLEDLWTEIEGDVSKRLFEGATMSNEQ